ncbi:hypothetical protein GCM10007147_06920 [Nocardiopsis kunsanensis]|uniref:Phytanoyl-CoA dioxygenase n=1 Tax=Nocardiopsis kunsanensis TaxID=141693 RepID=A0A918X8F4_9ACTN|nr:phytanoyl-CoA dioxygenase family protein [Nocardiopsis kunsanensis]GHD17595.1 hypothetical protein GCM10007147_06920 [Nocardiopsis kunsanensis]
MSTNTQAPQFHDMLSHSQVESYHDQGFINVPGVLSREEIEEQLTEGKKLLKHERTQPWEWNDGLAMDWVPDAGLRSEVMSKLVHHPKITAIAERLAGHPLRLFKSELFRKPAGEASSDTPVHYDEPSHPVSGRPITITAWVALVDVPVECGCMTFIPGSQNVVSPSEEDDGMYPLEHWPHLNYWPRVTHPMRAGDVHFHHGRVVHWAGENSTDITRISLATVYIDADAVYRPNFVYSELFPEDNLGGLEPGDPVRGERFPLAKLEG